MLVRHLSFFVTLARERHFARAAAACRVAQPTLSAAIRKLEEDPGVPLVVRSHRFVGLPPEGEERLTWSRQILTRFGVIPAAMPAVSFITERFCDHNPAATVDIRSLTSREIAEGLDAFDLDGGLTYLDNEPIPYVHACRSTASATSWWCRQTTPSPGARS